MDRTGRLRLELIDVHGKRLNERVDIFLRHHELTDTVAARDIDASKVILIKDLIPNPRGLYRIFIDPPSYLPVSTTVQIDGEKITDRVYTFAIDVEKVIRVEFPEWSKITHAHALLERSGKILGFENTTGERLYTSLDDIRRAGMLNILAKTRRTRLTHGGTVLDSITELLELRGDRFFASVPHSLREDVRNSVHDGLFAEVSGALHHPPQGFSLAGSYKTPDRYGNLQLTFFSSGDNWRADIDIDDANGLEHVFQVLRNSITRSPTHPYNIQQILIKDQEIDPAYKLIIRDDKVPKKRAAGGQEV
jgi:hypothetical protein